jgi:hypothetical protein
VPAKPRNKPNVRSLSRRTNTRERSEAILIICEGKKTEPNYFNAIKREYRLPSVRVLPSDGTDPKQVVNYAWKLFKDGDSSMHIDPKSFGYVYAVFDRDDHQGYQKAIDYAHDLGNRKTKGLESFKAIASNPCFELWLLLHFQAVTHAASREDVNISL